MTARINAIAPCSPAMAYALYLIGVGVLSIDRHGRIWRHAVITRRRVIKLPKPRRAENAGTKGYLRLTLYLLGRVIAMGVTVRTWNHRGVLRNEETGEELQFCEGLSSLVIFTNETIGLHPDGPFCAEPKPEQKVGE